MISYTIHFYNIVLIVKMSRQGYTCNVCCDDKIEFVTCMYCSEKACNTCYETYLVDVPEPRCMFCKKVWNHEFIQTNFRKGFIEGKYKTHRKKIIFERERALFPQTQVDIERNKNSDKIKEAIAERKKMIKKIKEEIFALERSLHRNDYYKEKEEKEQDEDEERVLEKKQKVLNIFCASKDCKGFLNNKYICGICDTKHCKDCRVILKDDEHKCDPNTLETIKMLKKDTKPCPKCNTPIFKIEGCDQMWCTQCQTAFSWKHGHIETGHVHNPHYWQYLQTQGRDLDAVRGMQNGNPVNQNRCIDLSYIGGTYNNHRGFGELCRSFIHVERYEIDHIVVPNYVHSNMDLRKKFLLNEMDEKNFKKNLHARDKKGLYNAEIRQILQMFYDVGKDILIKAYRMYREDARSFARDKKMNDIYKEINDLSTYTITQINSLSERFNYKVNTNVYNVAYIQKISSKDPETQKMILNV